MAAAMKLLIHEDYYSNRDL